MRYLLKLSAVLAILLAVTATAQDDYTMDNFMQAYRAAVTGDEVVALCEDYMTNSDDMELLRNVQGRWLRYDQPGAAAFAKKMAGVNPASGRWGYLYGRAIEDPVAAIQKGREMVTAFPNYSYSYRLLLGNYYQELFSGYADPEIAEKLAAMLPEDADHFDKALDVVPDEDWALQFVSAYQIYTGAYDDALSTLEKGTSLGKGWPSQEDYAVVYACRGDFAEARAAVEDLVDGLMEQGWDAAQRESYVANYYSSVLRDAKAYGEMVAFEKSHEGIDEDPDGLYNIACSYSLMGNADSAFAYLAHATAAGFDNVAHLGRDSDLEPLHTDPRWEKATAAAEAKWDAGAESRKAEAMAEKLDRPAPEFSLPGIDGQLVNLADLRGKVVVLDFWATWCGPCRMAMPVINEFVQSKPEDVLVFSIDVWEKGGEGPTEFMAENEYDMTLLFGNNQIAKDYGVQGIPYLCVIDQEGIIRYEHPGFSEGLGESLVWWTEDLLNAN